MTNFHDNSFEIDGSMHNVRVMRNMMINSPRIRSVISRRSAGPSIGSAISRTTRREDRPGSPADRASCSTTTPYLVRHHGGTTSNTHFRNNLILAQNSVDLAVALEAAAGTQANRPRRWFSVLPPTRTTLPPITTGSAPMPERRTRFNGIRRLGTRSTTSSRGHNAQTETRRYKTLEEYQQASKQDQHSILVDYDLFMNVPSLDGRDVKTVQKLYDAKDLISGSSRGLFRSIGASPCRTLRTALPDALPTWARLSWDKPRHIMGPGLDRRRTVMTSLDTELVPALRHLLGYRLRSF